jgi:DNA-cytosine methyltransferase
MNVLSLFDGMSCGRIALDRLGIPVDKYYASEIDKYAIQVSEANYPDIIRLGDVCDVKAEDLEPIDLLIAGSPCQGFSFAGKQLAFDDPRSALFFEFVRLLKECKPKYFLLENVRMKKEFLDIISEQVGCEPIFINSALVSAQSRQRYYWTNIPSIEQPEQRGIVLRDILESEVRDEFRYSKKSIEYMERGNDKWQQAGKRRADRYEQTADTEKSFAITANWHKGVPYNYFKETKPKKVGNIYPSGGQNGNIFSADGKSPTLSAGQGKTGRGIGSNNAPKIETKPKQVGVAVDIKGHDILKRVYSPEGKSPTLTTMGGGNREPKVLEDEAHWRKLTPLECERLQTVPDNYTNHVSNTQRYKMLGNGWTVEVIAHILRNMQLLEEGKELPESKGQLELGMD